MNRVDEVLAELAGYWDRNGDTIITVTAAVILVVVAIIAWRFHRTKARSRVLGALATFLTLAWESQGVWSTSAHVVHVPTHFLAGTFIVFQLLQGSALFKAEEDRKEKGHPGWAGRYTFVIAIAGGCYAALGENTPAGVFLRIVLPLLVIGYYWYQLVADRNDDSDEVKNLRKEMKSAQTKDDTVWVNPLIRILIKLGLKKPKGSKTTDAEREYRIELMVTYGYRVWAETFPVRFHLWRLRTVAGASAQEDAEEARVRLDRKIRVEEILLPGGARRHSRKRSDRQSTGQSVAGQSTGQLDSRPAVAPAVSRSSQLTSRLSVGQLTAQLPTGIGRLPVATDGASQSTATVAAQSVDSQSIATEPFPTDDGGLKDRLRQLIEARVVKADPIDGTVTVADARRAFSPDVGPMCGPDKARRLLREMELYREPTTTRGVIMRRPEDPINDEPQRVNGHTPDLAG